MALTVNRCSAHHLNYNAEEGCPFCNREGVSEGSKMEKVTEDPNAPAEKLIYKCPFCGSKSRYPRSCSRIKCRRSAGLNAQGRPLIAIFLCKFCGGKTIREDRVCTKYECRKKGGTRGMYYVNARL